MTGYADLEIHQSEDYGAQLIWTDLINEPYQVCHPIRMQARSATGQTLLDLSSLDQDAEHPGGTEATLVYSTEGGVIQILIPSAITATLPPGTLFYDLYVSYYSTTSDFISGGEGTVKRKKKLIYGQIIVEGSVTKNA